MVNSGNMLVDNLYLKLSRTLSLPTVTFITQSALFGEEEWFSIFSSNVYVTNVTFHAEDRGSAQAVASHYTYNSMYIDGVPAPPADYSSAAVLPLRGNSGSVSVIETLRTESDTPQSP